MSRSALRRGDDGDKSSAVSNSEEVIDENIAKSNPGNGAF